MNVQSILNGKGANVATIASSGSLAEATASLRERDVGALVVSPDGAVIEGIVSERDIVRSMAEHGDGALGRAVSSCMSGDVVVCRPDDSIESLMSLMTERRIRHLPVVDGDRRLAGIISIGDVVKARLGQLQRENAQLHDYIQGNVG